MEYGFDDQGRMTKITTWQEFDQNTGEGTSGSSVTTWNYHPQRGWLENKRYADETGPDYAYWPSGRLQTRAWAREVNNERLVTTYTFNEAGDLTTVVYTDDTPPVTHT